MDTVHKNITNFFEEKLDDLQCNRDTKSYVVGIFVKFKSSEFDLSQDSVTLLFAQARNNHNFLSYQNLGDWLFFINSIFPESLKNASPDYYSTIARLSYYSCYKLINREWKLFEELADEYTSLTKSVRDKLEFKL